MPERPPDQIEEAPGLLQPRARAPRGPALGRCSISAAILGRASAGSSLPGSLQLPGCSALSSGPFSAFSHRIRSGSTSLRSGIAAPGSAPKLRGRGR
jgi:hypothetical protein